MSINIDNLPNLSKDQQQYLIEVIERTKNIKRDAGEEENKDFIKNQVQNLTDEEQLVILNKFSEKYPEFEIFRDRFLESKTSGRISFILNILSSFL